MTVPSPRARYGDRRLSRQQRLKRLALLSAAVRETAEEAAVLAREVVAAVPRGGDDDLVRATAAHATDEAGRGRLLVVLVDLDGIALADAAALLDLDVTTARPLLELARTGGRPLGATCRGWGLASGRARLTASELEAGREHLLLCRRCRERRAAVEAARRQLVTRAGGAAGLIGAAELALAGGAVTSTVGAVLGGKAVAGAVAGIGAAVLATGATVAAAQPAGFVPRPRETAPAVSSSPDPTTDVAPSPLPGGLPPSPRPTGGPTGVLPTTPVAPLLPTSLPDLTTGLDGVPLELPTSLPLPLPTALPTSLPLPSSLPLPLPTELPLPLPSGLPPVPLLP